MNLNQFLEHFRLSCQSRHIPIISQPTQNFIKHVLDLKQPKHCLEIGCAVGYSTIFMANCLPSMSITSFERSYPSYLEAIHYTKQLGLQSISIHPFNFTKINVKKFILGKIDFVFIDGQKSQYGNYMNNIKTILSKSSTIIIDDIIKFHYKLGSLYEYLSKNQIKYEIIKLEEDDGVMLIQNN